MLPREASGVLGVSEETVKNWIRSERLPGREWVTPKGEKRYYAEAEAVEAEAASRGEVARVDTVREAADRVGMNSERLAGQIIEEFRAQGAKVGTELIRNREERQAQHAELLELLGALREGQARFLAGRERYVEALEGLREEFAESRRLIRETAEREKRYQERVLRLMEERDGPRRDRQAPPNDAGPPDRADEE
jgi:hypothetical protein